MVKKKVDGESKRNKFARLATARTKIVLQKIKVLGNCSNNYIYEYTEQDVKRIFEAIENYRESVSTVSELYLSTVSNNTNEVMKVLSVIATTALPLTVISGIYGTNFQWLPGASTSYGFWIMIAVMVGVMGSMLFYFKRRGWF